MQYVDVSSAQCTLARRNTTLAIQMEAAFSIYILLQNQQKNIHEFSLVNSRKKKDFLNEMSHYTITLLNQFQHIRVLHKLLWPYILYNYTHHNLFYKHVSELSNTPQLWQT